MSRPDLVCLIRSPKHSTRLLRDLKTEKTTCSELYPSGAEIMSSNIGKIFTQQSRLNPPPERLRLSER